MDNVNKNKRQRVKETMKNEEGQSDKNCFPCFIQKKMKRTKQ